MTKILGLTLMAFLVGAVSGGCRKGSGPEAQPGAISDVRPRVIVSTDIGGTDPDDFQSLVYLLVYADRLDIEGLISSPYGQGRKKHILLALRYYEKDYPLLKSWSDAYPSPDYLRDVTKQGALDFAGPEGVGQPTEGSKWIIECARRDDPRPLHVLVWGGLEDLAQALHDAPDILPKLRVYFIGGPNKKWSPGAYQYIAEHHHDLWIIECNATYRGWFVGGNQSGDYGNERFVEKHVAGHGALGDFFYSSLSVWKAGDAPSVARLIHGDPEDPSQASWGGQFVRAWKRPHLRFQRLTTRADSIEQFGILELELPLSNVGGERVFATMEVENQSLPGLIDGNGVRFLFSPKEAKVYTYRIKSSDPSLNGRTGSITAYLPPEENRFHPDPSIPNWWTDDPARELMEKGHIGAKTISRWREAFLDDFRNRMDRCKFMKDAYGALQSEILAWQQILAGDFPLLAVLRLPK